MDIDSNLVLWIPLFVTILLGIISVISTIIAFLSGAIERYKQQRITHFEQFDRVRREIEERRVE